MDSEIRGRKRQREESINDTADNTSMSDSSEKELLGALQDGGNQTAPCSFCLEAIFLPKFENENRSDQSIRNRMRELVSSGYGYAEASLKHSGSLLLWSGGQRFYSKNSTNNKFSWVGEILLRQHFYRVSVLQRKQAASNSAIDNNNNTHDDDVESLFKACSDYVEKHRLTLSFECVTSVLGDHGAIPNQDYLILTCVADRTRPDKPFYSTHDLLQFAQKFCLPHNDTWVFTSQSSIDGLFQFYDQSRETGLANTTVTALTDAADVRIASMYPHETVHSNILEGFVIRYVSYADSKLPKEQFLDSIKIFSKKAEDISTQIPTDAPLSFDLVTPDGKQSAPAGLSVDIRTVHSEPDKQSATMASVVTQSNAKCDSKNAFDQSLYETLLRSGPRPTVVDHVSASTSKALQELLPRYANTVLNNSAAAGAHDRDTQNIARVIDTLASMGAKVQYSVFRERKVATRTTNNKDDRYLCMVHVFLDQTFKKYRRVQQQSEKGVMDLFRGFCFEICTGGKGPSEAAGKPKEGSATTIFSAEADEENSASGLILKMKFLPYMVRTFGCRNGMNCVRQGGPVKFNDYVDNLFARWGVSPKSHERWLPYLYAWGEYANACLSGTSAKLQAPVLSSPPLSESCYLQHLAYFEDLYYNNKLVTSVQEATGNVFKGLVVVMAHDEEAAREAAEFIAKEWLGGAQLLQGGTDSISHESMVKFCTRSIRGRVCWGAVTALKMRSIRTLPESDKNYLSLVLVGCSEEEVQGLLLPQKEQRKLLGMSSAWRKTTCGALVEVPRLFMDSSQSNEVLVSAAKSQIWAISDKIGDVDERPGLLVFFPASIPGCGKSTVVNSTTELEEAIWAIEDSMAKQTTAAKKRQIDILSGDKLRDKKVKYWKYVQEQRLLNNSAVTVADKNVPLSTWEQVARICAQTNGRAVAVVPESFGVFDTTFIDGIRAPDSPNTIQAQKHHYPFSLTYLAVCIARIMSRRSGSHVGKLDPKTPHACMVVCKFFSLYRGLSAEEFLEVLKMKMAKARAQMVSPPVLVPFFDQQKPEGLPSDLRDLLVEALQVQAGLDAKNTDFEKESGKSFMVRLEARLRECINMHQPFLLDLAVDEGASRKGFVRQVAQSLLEAENLEPSAGGFINIVALDISGMDAVLGCLRNRLEQDPFADDEYDGPGYTRNAHVTMAHYSQLHQDSMRAQFEPILGQEVSLYVTGLVWNQTIKALSVDVAATTCDGIDVPKPLNSFPHITVWHDTGISPAESNKLPELLASGGAQKLTLNETIVLKGKISFWSLNQH